MSMFVEAFDEVRELEQGFPRQRVGTLPGGKFRQHIFPTPCFALKRRLYSRK
ncbi:MAG: hypothetical protein OQK94_02470 [Gammaproteobacteria bacterium]|nr:hypothetical protein [Gammaproteobacteria bacterium]MCW9089459.1 hypothetical protein [Gammaproteobacteria bacterium]